MARRPAALLTLAAERQRMAGWPGWPARVHPPPAPLHLGGPAPGRGRDEVDLPESDRGIENHIPFVNRLVAWWGRMRERGWKDQATPEQRAALKRDLEPVVEIYREL